MVMSNAAADITLESYLLLKASTLLILIRHRRW